MFTSSYQKVEKYSAWFHSKSYSQKKNVILAWGRKHIQFPKQVFFWNMKDGVIPELVILNVFFTEWSKKPVSLIQIVCKICVWLRIRTYYVSVFTWKWSGAKFEGLHITFCLTASAEKSHRAVAPTLKFPGWKNTTTGHFSAGIDPVNSQVKTCGSVTLDSRKKRQSCISQVISSSCFSQN